MLAKELMNTENMIAAATSPLVIPKPCPTSATTGLPNSLLQMKPALMHSFLIRIEKWGFTTLR